MEEQSTRKFLFPAILLLGAFIFCLTGCTKSTQTATETVAETIPIVYQLDFEDPEVYSGWHVGGPGTDLLWLENTQDGKYVFEFSSGFIQNWDQSLSDVEISVEVEFHSDEAVEASLGCRISADAGYWFTVTSEKHWMIGKYFNGQSSTLTKGDSDVILPDANHVVGRCAGANLSLLVNDVELGSATDADIPSGGVNLGYNSSAAGSGSFDNLLVLDLFAPTAAPEGGQVVLYAETFDDPSTLTGWDVKQGQAEVKDGAYHLSVDNGDTVAIQRDRNFTDTVLTVDLEFLGPDPATAHISCRNQVGGYSFSISSDGHWKIDRSDGKLTSGDTQALQAGVNKVAISCVGDKFSFSLNGVEIGSAQDSAYLEGEIALGLDSSGKAEVVFDNLTVSGPASGAVEATPTQPPAAIATSTPTPTQVPTAIATGTPTLRPTPIPTEDLILYQTDFENDDESLSKWRTFAYSFKSHSLSTEGYDVFTNTSFYRFSATKTNQRIFAIYDADLDTSDVDISMHASAPPYDGGVGLVCRYTEAGWYQFMVEPVGTWSVRLVQPDESGQLHFYKVASGTRWLGQNVDLRAECKSDRLTFYIDGVEQTSLHDATFPQGRVGVLSWSFDQAGQQVGFIDRFAVQRAQWSESNIPGPAPTPETDGAIYTTDFGNLDALSQYWYTFTRIEALGPGAERRTNYYINDFDPGTNVEISADLAAGSATRSLICRYSTDGWYEAGFGSSPAGKSIGLARLEHNGNGELETTWLTSKLVDAASASKMTLTCVGNQLKVSIDGELYLSVEDNLWQSGRYGLSYVNPTPLSPKIAFSSYTVRPVQAPQPGDVIYDEVFDTPEKIASNWNMDASGADPRVAIQDNSLVLTPGDNVLHPGIDLRAENIELDLDLDFLAQSTIVLHCRTDSAASVGFDIHSNGDWGIVLNFEQMLANGNSASIHSGNNRFTIKCMDNLLSLIANGETLATVEQPSYVPTVGKVGFDVFEGSSQVRINSLALKLFQSTSRLSAPTLPNQVSIPVNQSGETVYAWNPWDFLGVAGHKDRAWVWLQWHREAPSEQSNQIVVLPDKGLNVWTYRNQDLYDLPLAMTVDTTFTGKSGAIGLMCRYTQLGRYEFTIQPDGSWSIRRNTSEWYAPQTANITVLAHGTSGPIQPESNQLTAICQGDELIFNANGEELGRVQDDLYPEGQVGIFFDAYTSGSFANLNVQYLER